VITLLEHFPRTTLESTDRRPLVGALIAKGSPPLCKDGPARIAEGGVPDPASDQGWKLEEASKNT